MSLSNGRKAKRTGLKLLVCLNIYLFVCTTIYECSMSYKYVFSVTLSKLIPVHVTWDTLSDLVRCIQFEKLEKRPWGSVDFISFTGKPATLLKGTLLHGRFSSFWNCTNCTKRRKTAYIFYFRTAKKNIYRIDPAYGPTIVEKLSTLDLYSDRGFACETDLWDLRVRARTSLVLFCFHKK